MVGIRVTTLGAKGREIVDRTAPWCTSTSCPTVIEGRPDRRRRRLPRGIPDRAHRRAEPERSAQLGSLVAVLVLEPMVRRTGHWIVRTR